MMFIGVASKRLIAALLALIVALVVVCGIVQALSPDEILPLTQIKPGMEGVGKTVVQGNLIETFYVRVVDIIDRPGEYDYILVRVSGGAITRSGGVASGMSGSPIYIDGKLIGALSASAYWQDSSEPLAWVTPIELMLKLTEFVQQEATEPIEALAGQLAGLSTGADSNCKPVDSVTGQITELQFTSNQPSVEELTLNTHRVYLMHLCPALLTGGLSSRAFTRLREGLNRELLDANLSCLLPGIGSTEQMEGFFDAMSRGIGDNTGNFLTAPAGGVIQTDSATLGFVPGAPIGALLMTGDLYYGWLGTITFTQAITLETQTKSVVVGMGHQLLGAGDSHYIMNPVAILDTVHGLNRSFKVGVPTGMDGVPIISGVIAQDRDQGIAGIIGEQPQGIQLNLQVRDSDRLMKTFSVQLTPMREFYPILTLIAAYQAVYETINRVGPGTAHIRYSIKGEGLPEPIEREDVFVTSSDIALLGPLQVARVMYLLAWNEFADIKLTEVDVEINITKNIETIVIEGIDVDQRICNPGDEIQYAVALRSYRGERKIINGSLTIPDTFPGGEVKVWAIPAALAERLIAYGGWGWVRPMPHSDDLEELVEEIETAAKGDTFWIILEGLGCPYIDCSQEEEVATVREIVELADLSLDGAVTGFAYRTLLVKKDLH